MRPAVDTPEPTPEPMTLEAIKRDPWNAIVLDLPKDGTHALYAAVVEAAKYLRSECPGDPMPPFEL